MEMVRFQDMPYVRPDMEALKAAYQETIEKLKSAASYEEARSAFFALQEAEDRRATMAVLCSVRNTIDTTDAYYDGEMKWLRTENASLIPLRKGYQEALATSPFRPHFEAEFGKQMFRLIDAGLKTSDERIIPDVIREGNLCQQYQKDSALAVTDFRGEKCNFYGLLKHMESPDRQERKEAFHAWAALYEKISPQLDAEYDELVHLRDKMAHTLGFESYTDLAYLERRRFDYTKEDAANFRKQVREIVTPAVAAIRERQRQLLGVDKLRYYDEALIFPEGNADPEGTMEELVQKALAMYKEMSPETGEFFSFMVKYRLFDLETRPGKRMGGYMTRFPDYRAPFIFSNFNGTSADVDVLTHEAGHAFQGYLAMRSIPVSMLSGSTAEINEIHSMSMEHFAYPWMESFFGEGCVDAPKAYTPINENKVKLAKWAFLGKQWHDSSTLCNWMYPMTLSIAPYRGYKGDLDLDAKYMSAVVGEEYTRESIEFDCERISHLLRTMTAVSFNLRLGSTNLRKDHDAYPAWLFDKEPDFKAFEQGTVKMDREDMEKGLDMMYTMMGWDVETGIPTRETLEKFDLKDCADKLAELGLIK